MSRKAVILAAGRGSRLCPITPFIPKEMLPVDGLPAIHYVLTELIDAGYADLMIVISKGKEIIRDYLTGEIAPKGQDATKLCIERERLLTALNITFAYQERLLGTAHAVKLAARFMGEDPMLVVYPDDVMYDPTVRRVISDQTRKLSDICEKTGDSVVLSAPIDGSEAHQYGVLRLCAHGEGLRVSDIVEKPTDYREAIAHVLIGRMMITPRVMESISKCALNDREGIIPPLMTEAMIGRLSASVYDGIRYDLGSHVGYANLLRDIYCRGTY